MRKRGHSGVDVTPEMDRSVAVPQAPKKRILNSYRSSTESLVEDNMSAEDLLDLLDENDVQVMKSLTAYTDFIHD